MKFRTSVNNRYPGFLAFVTCFNVTEGNSEYSYIKEKILYCYTPIQLDKAETHSLIKKYVN